MPGRVQSRRLLLACSLQSAPASMRLHALSSRHPPRQLDLIPPVVAGLQRAVVDSRYSAGERGEGEPPMADQDENQNGRKPMIVGGAKERPTDEMNEITQMIEEAQHSSRA